MEESDSSKVIVLLFGAISALALKLSKIRKSLKLLNK